MGRNTFGSNPMNSRPRHSIIRSGLNPRGSDEYAFTGDDNSNLAQDSRLPGSAGESVGSAYRSFFRDSGITDTIRTARRNLLWRACCLIPRIPPRPQR